MEDREEGVTGDVVGKAVDKDLAVGDIRIRDGADNGEERGMVEDSIDGEGNKLVLGVVFKERFDVLRGRLGIGVGWGKVGVGVGVILLDFLMRFGSIRFLKELSFLKVPILGHGRW